MSAGKIIGFVVAAIVIIFGVLFILGAGASTGGGVLWVIIGVVLVAIGLVIIFFASRRPAPPPGEEKVVLNIDLPGNVKLESLKCKSCGGVLSSDNIKMVAGAPVVTCPYCKTSYQLTEEPKW
jgi:hypothetical protein